MAHTHNVTDTDARFTIDPITRAITKVESPKVSLIVGDHNSERFSFDMPRYIEGHDMHLCNVVRVHYMNSSNTSKVEQSVGVYEVNDFGVLSTDDTKVGFTWLISNNATKYVGKLAFTIQFACMTGHRVDYSWQTGVYSAMSISDGINGSEIVFDEYADILQQWWLKIYASSELPIKIYTGDEFAALNGNTESQVLYLLEDDPTLENIADHETRISDNTRNITDHETRITDHETRITDHETRITDHETRISGNTRNITDHETRISDNTRDIADHETRIRDNTRDIADHETRISASSTKLLSHDIFIGDNKNDITSLQTYKDTFLGQQNYTPLRYKNSKVDPSTEINQTFAGGLWLFNVSLLGGCSVSVIMDTIDEYSSVFYLNTEYDNSTEVKFIPFAIKLTRGTDQGNINASLISYRYDSELNCFVESYIDYGYYIYGRPFAFQNPRG